MTDLSNKICVITGAAQGIGAGIAARFCAAGARVILTDKNETAVAAIAKTLGAESRVLDVAREADWAEMALAFPAIDVLVNNAGITGFEAGMVAHDPENAKLDDWRAVHRVNLDGVFLGCRYGIRAMRKSGKGSIINISSRSGMVGIPMAAAYAASKAGVRNHTKTVALYCAQEGLDIRCNSIHPAAILTPMWEPMLGDGPDRAERMAALVADTPMRRFGTVEEVAEMAALLAGDGAAYMTGTEITMDGGILAGSAATPTQ